MATENETNNMPEIPDKVVDKILDISKSDISDAVSERKKTIVGGHLDAPIRQEIHQLKIEDVCKPSELDEIRSLNVEKINIVPWLDPLGRSLVGVYVKGQRHDNETGLDYRYEIGKSFTDEQQEKVDNALQKIAEELAKSEDWKIRYAVATNENTLPDTLIELSGDKSEAVRWSVLLNENTPPDILPKIAIDIAKNGSDPWHLERLATLVSNKNLEVLKYLAQNENTPPETLADLANNKEWYIRKAVAENKNAPADILAHLAEDEMPHVHQAAIANENYQEPHMSLNDALEECKKEVEEDAKNTQDTQNINNDTQNHDDEHEDR